MIQLCVDLRQVMSRDSQDDGPNMQKQKEDQDERLLKWSIMDKNQVPEKVASSIFNEYGGK